MLHGSLHVGTTLLLGGQSVILKLLHQGLYPCRVASSRVETSWLSLSELLHPEQHCLHPHSNSLWHLEPKHLIREVDRSWLTSQGTVYSSLANGQSAAGSQGFVCLAQGGIAATIHTEGFGQALKN